MKRLAIASLLVCVGVLVSTVYAQWPNSVRTIMAFTGGATIQAGGALSGGVITNAGASGSQTINLPPASAGICYTVALAAAQDVDVDVATGDRILVLTDATNDKISSDATTGSFVELIAIDDTNWLPLTRTGTWTDAN